MINVSIKVSILRGILVSALWRLHQLINLAKCVHKNKKWIHRMIHTTRAGAYCYIVNCFESYLILVISYSSIMNTKLIQWIYNLRSNVEKKGEKNLTLKFQTVIPLIYWQIDCVVSLFMCCPWTSTQSKVASFQRKILCLTGSDVIPTATSASLE